MQLRIKKLYQATVLIKPVDLMYIYPGLMKIEFFDFFGIGLCCVHVSARGACTQACARIQRVIIRTEDQCEDMLKIL